MGSSGSSLDAFLLCYLLSLMVIFMLSFRRQLLFFQSLAPRGRLLHDSKILGMLPPPALGQGGFVLFGIIFLGALLGTFYLKENVIFPAVAIGAYFMYFAQIRVMGEVRHKTHTIPLVLVVLVVQRGVDHLDPIETLFLIKCIAVQVYFSSAIQKLRTSSWRWMNGKSLQAYLMRYYLVGGFSLAWQLAKSKKLCCGISIFTVLFELSSILALFWVEFGHVFVVVGVCFHLGIYLAMRINYLKFFCPIYWVFLV